MSLAIVPRLRREVSAAPRARRRMVEFANVRPPEWSTRQPTNSLTNQPTHQLTEDGASPARRSSGCAEQWESRDPLPIAPCHAGRRRSTVLLYCSSSQTSVVKQQLPESREAGEDPSTRFARSG